MEKIMDITPAQLELYRRSAREREATREQKLEARRERAWEVAHQAADLLKREFGATRVVVFGSLIHPELFHVHSDIDLAVWNIQHYYRAVAHLLDLDPDVNFDLVPIEDAKPAILELIEKEGIEL
jgi:predicted nucleotidyltransferase